MILLASWWYWFPIFYLWFSWNVMATLLSLVGKRTKDLCFVALHSQYNTLRRLTYCRQNYRQDIQIYTIFGILKNSFRENYSFFEGHNTLWLFSPTLSCQAPPFLKYFQPPPLKFKPSLQQKLFCNPLSKPNISNSTFLFSLNSNVEEK